MNEKRRSAVFALVLTVVVLCAGALPAAHAAEGARPGRGFDHLQTGFPLTGAHTTVRCESCHARGVFKGTPTQCATCHLPGSGRATTVKPANHIPTTAPCDQCHNTRRFADARFDHSAVVPGSCATCHNGVTAKGKPAAHVPTSDSCDQCHSTRLWRPATYDHSRIAPGTCSSCHANDKPGNHVPTSQSCDACHNTRAWLPARFDHALVVPGTCVQCHQKPGNHIPTTGACDTCHRTTAWRPAIGVDHSTVVPGTCATCHNGSSATGKPSSHFVTSRACDACHSTTAWLPTRSYSHTSALFPGQHNSSVTCIRCHTGNSETVVWPYSAYQPDCAGCHASRYKPDPHKKTEVPTTIRYTVSELRNCAGSCHIYTDNTFTQIRRQRSGEHRSSSGDF